MTYDDITFVGVAWNEEQRAYDVLHLARDWFTHTVVGVQESTDRTLDIALEILDRPTDKIIEHPHYGYGDRSMPNLISNVTTKWAFVLAFDEMPDTELLESLGETKHAGKTDAYWIPFTSYVEGIEYTEQHGHLRLFRQHLGWPITLHSRPKGKYEAMWPTGRIIHTRSLDEMMQDYLRYYEIGRGNPGWDNHNRLMMHDACTSVASVHGWDFVKHHEWWPLVESIAFDG